MSNKKLVFGVGINDLTEPVSKYIWVNKKSIRAWRCPFYAAWCHMLERCYCPKYKKKKPSYDEVSACDDWLYFSKFKAWMSKQDWIGKQLDKDILHRGNKIYSPEYCVFVDSNINNLFINSPSRKGNCPLGVTFEKSTCKYVSVISKNGQQRKIGRFICRSQAHAAWQTEKAKHIEQLAAEQTDERIKNALMARVYQLRDDLANGKETIKL